MVHTAVVVYVVGWFVTTVGVYLAATCLRDGAAPAPLSFGGLTILAGALWPLLVIGAFELGSVVTYAKLQSRSPERVWAAPTLVPRS